MLKVSIELFPFGDSKRRKRLATVYIANRGWSTANEYGERDICRYEVWTGRNPNQHKRPGEGGTIQHRRSDGAYRLVSEALKGLEGP